MFSLVTLILLLFNILATILILIMAGLAITLLLALFLIIAIVIGLKEKSIFKGLKIFVIAASILTILPATVYFFAYKLENVLLLSSNQLLLVGGITGLLFSILFGVFTFRIFEKLTKKIYDSISKK